MCVCVRDQVCQCRCLQVSVCVCVCVCGWVEPCVFARNHVCEYVHVCTCACGYTWLCFWMSVNLNVWVGGMHVVCQFLFNKKARHRILFLQDRSRKTCFTWIYEWYDRRPFIKVCALLVCLWVSLSLSPSLSLSLSLSQAWLITFLVVYIPLR